MHAEEISKAVQETVDSGWYLLGKRVRKFEEEYAAYIGTKYCVACGNGLDALSLILRAYIEMGIMKEGDEVIVPPAPISPVFYPSRKTICGLFS